MRVRIEASRRREGWLSHKSWRVYCSPPFYLHLWRGFYDSQLKALTAPCNDALFSLGELLVSSVGSYYEAEEELFLWRKAYAMSAIINVENAIKCATKGDVYCQTKIEEWAIKV